MTTAVTTYTVPKEIEKKILTAIELKKELEQYEKEIKEQLTEAMIANGVYSIKNESYSVTLATRNTFKAVGDIPTEFAKTTLDTTKVGSHYKMYGEVPDGIEKTESKYITWRAK
jgi:hypothetical protein